MSLYGDVWVPHGAHVALFNKSNSVKCLFEPILFELCRYSLYMREFLKLFQCGTKFMYASDMAHLEALDQS